MNARDRLAAMLVGDPVDRLPVMPITMMRAAEVIGSPYGKYALDHRVLVDAQIATAERFGFDQVSAITETREARDCGAALAYFEDQPYAVDETCSRLAEKRDLATMALPDPAEAPAMSDRLAAVRLLRRYVGGDGIVEGWVEGPCTAAADLRGINRLMLDFSDDPPFVQRLFDFVLELAVRFAAAQVDAGADVVGIGDPTASLAGPRVYRQFTWTRQKALVDAIHACGAKVRLHICGNTRAILGEMAELGADIIDIDSAVPMFEARARVGGEAVLLGGVDPVRVLLRGTPEDVRKAVMAVRDAAGPRYIVGAGCEVPAGTPEANLMMLRECAELATATAR